MWSGAIVNIPEGWALCDGNNGTPNLTDRFVVGAGNAYSVDATGGSADAIVVAHSHTGSTSTASLTGSYTQGARNITIGSATGVLSSEVGPAASNTAGGGGGSAHGKLNVNASHSHTFTTDSNGSSGTNANLPPYYALAFIMRTV